MLAKYDCNLTDLKLFALLSQGESLTSVSRALGVPQPTISRRLKRLENQLGTRLLERHQRQVKLTVQGAELLSNVIRILIEYDRMLDKVDTPPSEPLD